MPERRERARLVEEARKAPLERIEARLPLGPDRLVIAALGEIAGQVLLDRDLEVEIRVRRQIGQPETADAQSLLDLVLVQRITPGQSDLGGHRGALTSGRSG